MIQDASVTRDNTRETNQGLFSRFSKSESAAATVILAILLLGLVFAMVSIVRLEYVPEWKNEAEQDYVYEIWDAFLGLKIRIDMLSGLMESGSYPANDFSITVPFIMGGSDIPGLESSTSDGKLEVNKERCVMTITLYNSTNEAVKFYNFDCGGITCYSQNTQYPDQIFRYENGALILADGKSSLMKQPPLFTIEENKTKKDSYTVIIRAVNLSGKANSVSSNTITPLQLTGSGVGPVYNSSANKNISISSFDLTIATKYPDAWFAYLNEIAQDKGLVHGTDYKVESFPDTGFVRFSFLPSKKLENLYVSKAVIHTEIGAL